MFEQYSTTERKNAFSQLHSNLKIAVVAALAYLLLVNLLGYAVGENSLTVFNDWRQVIISYIPSLGYPLAALVLWFCRKSAIGENYPYWLIVSILGSISSAFLAVFTVDQLGTIDPSIGVFGRFIGIAVLATILIFYTVPLTALFYYLTTLRKH
ncbi:MAG: hypothetical protein LC768_12595 [Acidobacteria bacterium]|nr:hypothetical protein [Acidobacteriota bacterium]MCA1639150.1 hypothetical protein [Acidobacteriota bacterium]